MNLWEKLWTMTSSHVMIAVLEVDHELLQESEDYLMGSRLKCLSSILDCDRSYDSRCNEDLALFDSVVLGLANLIK